MPKYQALRSIVAAAIAMNEWPKQSGGKPYPCNVQNVTTVNGDIPVIKLDDSFFAKNGGNEQVLHQLQAQACLTKTAMQVEGARVSTFYKAKDGSPRPGFQVTIVAETNANQDRGPAKSVDDRLAEAWTSVMEKMTDDEAAALADALDGKPAPFQLAKLERVLRAAPAEEQAEGRGEQKNEVPF